MYFLHLMVKVFLSMSKSCATFISVSYPRYVITVIDHQGFFPLNCIKYTER